MKAKADRHLRPHPQGAEVARHPPGTPGELAVQQPFTRADDSYGAGITGRALLEQLVETSDRRSRRPDIVPFLDELLPLRLREDRKLGKAAIQLSHHPFQQGMEMSGQALDRRGVEQGGRVLDLADDLPLRLGEIDRQIEPGDSPVHRHWMESEAPGADLGRRQVVQTEQNLKQRVVAQVALGFQGLDQDLERQVLVRIGRQRALADQRQQIAERQRSIDLHCEHQRIGEVPDQRLELKAAAVRDRSADQDLLLAGIAVEEGVEHRQQGHEKRAPLMAAEGTERRRQRSGEGDR